MFFRITNTSYFKHLQEGAYFIFMAQICGYKDRKNGELINKYEMIIVRNCLKWDGNKIWR